jgi:interleukin enhancer-binding factor 2
MEVEDIGEPRAPLLDTPYTGEVDYPGEYQEMSGDQEQEGIEDYAEEEQPLKQLYIPIDLTEASELFPPAAPAQTTEALSQAILERSEQLTPSPEDQAAVNALLAKVTSVLEAMAVRQEQLDGMAVEEIKSVGAHKKGTLLAGQKVAEVAIILKDWPTYTAAEQLSTVLKERLTSKEATIEYTVSVAQSTVVVSEGSAKVVIMVTCFPQSVHEKQNDSNPEQPKNGVALADIDTGLTAIRHTRWFEENVSHTSVKILARLLKDLSLRTSHLNHLTEWHCELLAHFCILSHSNSQPLSVPSAFK